MHSFRVHGASETLEFLILEFDQEPSVESSDYLDYFGDMLY